MQASITAGPITILAVKGNVDANTFRELVEKGERVVDQGYSKLIIDLHEVNQVGSGGLMALQTIAGIASGKGGRMVITGLNEQDQQVMQLGGFDKISSIFSDMTSARASFG
jgi:anti-anti-sigma factor